MKNLKTAYLLDFYGSLLNDKQKEILEMYFQDDLSLSEIASCMNMTRQGVYDNIKRGEKEILSYEEKMNLMGRFLKISEYIDSVSEKISPDKIIGKQDYLEIKDVFSKIKSMI